MSIRPFKIIERKLDPSGGACVKPAIREYWNNNLPPCKLVFPPPDSI